MLNRRQLLLIVGGLTIVLISGLALMAIEFTEPTLVSVDNQWGAISENTSEIKSYIAVDNPNSFGIPPVLNIRHEVRMNQVTIARGEQRGVRLSSGTNTIYLTTEMDNTKISDWWVTHVDKRERSTVTIDPKVSVRWTPFTINLPNQQEPVQTDILEPLNTETEETVELIHPPHLIIDSQKADWGEPTENRTPIDVSTTFANRFSSEATIENVTYRITLNEVAVANNQISTIYRIPPETTKAIEMRLFMRNPKMNDWWVSHLERGESTVVTIEIYATVSADGTSERVTIQFPDQTTSVETEILG